MEHQPTWLDQADGPARAVAMVVGRALAAIACPARALRTRRRGRGPGLIGHRSWAPIDDDPLATPLIAEQFVAGADVPHLLPVAPDR